MQRNNFYDQNWRGSGLGEYPPKFGTPYYFCNSPTSNLVYKLGLGSSLPRNNFWDQNWQGSGLGEYPKRFGSISATVECSNLKFGIQFGLGKELAKKQLLGPQSAGVRARVASQKNLGHPFLFLQSLKLASSNLLYNFALGIAYQETTFRTKTGGGLAREH